MPLPQMAESKPINESILRTDSSSSPAIAPLIIVWTANAVFHCIVMLFPSATGASQSGTFKSIWRNKPCFLSTSFP